MDEDDKSGIWLEVSEVRFDTGKKGCTVLLKADRGQPKPVWWPVSDTAAAAKSPNAAFETYKAILGEMDKKRVVLARLSCDESSNLHCVAFRFQSADLGSR